MPLPAPSCPPDVTPDVCCNSIALIGERIRTVAFLGLLECLDESCAKPFRSYMTFGPRIEDVIGDSLIITHQDTTPIASSTTAGGRLLAHRAERSTYLLELRENGWPTAKEVNGVIEVPDGAVISHYAHHAMGHAERMYHALLDAAVARDNGQRLFPLPQNSHILEGHIRVSNLRPIGPQSVQVAHAVTIEVDHTPGPRPPAVL